MIKEIRNSKVSKVICAYLALMIFIQVTQPMQAYALTSGPSQPEFNAFTPIGTSDMVSLTSGNFNYNIPIMDVGGYPLNLAYDSGITMSKEASWVGLGWNLNVGQISRQVRGLPDDFRGDKMHYENNMRKNVTVGTNFNLSPAVFGKDFPFSLGLGVQYNNYEGMTFKPSIGMSFSLAENTGVGFDFSVTGSVGEGPSVNANVSISKKVGKHEGLDKVLGGSIGVGLSSRKGLSNMTMSLNSERSTFGEKELKNGEMSIGKTVYEQGGVGGSISYNTTNNYTPTKRVAYENMNKSFTAGLGTEVFGGEGKGSIMGYGSYQRIAADFKDRWVPAYGYENTQFKFGEGVLDFNREKEKVVSKNTTVLPVTNYTHDIYSVQGQGASGMFRPFRSQVSYLYNDRVVDRGLSSSGGVQFGVGNLTHTGISISATPSKTSTGPWNRRNYAKALLAESLNPNENDLSYEQVTHKMVGELNVDEEVTVYEDQLAGSSPMSFHLDGSPFRRKLIPSYGVQTLDPTKVKLDINIPIKRKGRFVRNQSVQKVTAQEADNNFIFKNVHAQPHHTAGMKILQPNGATYVFGETAYSVAKVESTFDVSGRTGSNITGLVEYDSSPFAKNYSKDSDYYLNKITTPAYAHTYLLSSVLSSDYEDLTDDGPTDDDLGAYTLFTYDDTSKDELYKWRTPFDENKASYNEGLKTSQKDQKGSYLYGAKQLKYIQKIETKTHYAFFELEDRKDGVGVKGEHGGAGDQRMKRLKSIRLYSKPEIKNAIKRIDFSAYLGLEITLDDLLKELDKVGVFPIKTAHFEYNYSLCQGIPSYKELGGSSEIEEGGKLTLERVYFTYRGSKMGMYTPYVFDYGQNAVLESDRLINNPPYEMKGFDVWGNYKKNNTTSSQLSNTEFPFVKQDKDQANDNAQAWILKKINLPSGGTIAVTTESDDYKFVQNKKAMQMFKVIGAGNDLDPTTRSNKLYRPGGFNHNKYLYVDVNNGSQSLSNEEFVNQYLSQNRDLPIYFNFLLNMNAHHSDYVSGYFEIDYGRKHELQVIDGIAIIPLQFSRKEGGLTAGSHVNPIAKGGWGFGRSYLNRAVYSLGGEETNKSFGSIVQDLVGSIVTMKEIFTGPNQALELRNCAREFDTNKSWIRLENPDGRKFGGGCRVTKVELSDNWDVMTDGANYKNEFYGQEYNYSLDDGTSSGVATFEPNASKENPLVGPIYGGNDLNYADKISSPRASNYTEAPIGEGFFPSPGVTYSRVTVSNLKKDDLVPGLKVRKHATGRVVTDHYTTYDCPTKVDFTPVNMSYDKKRTPLLMMLSVRSADHLVATQGFSIETNDMNGKVRQTAVYAERDLENPELVEEALSRVVYKYNLDEAKNLVNKLTTINSKGEVVENLIGVDYEVINDFNESKANTDMGGVDTNFASFLAGVFPAVVPVPLPKSAKHESILRTATTTKVINKRSVLIEKIAYDIGARVSTKNLAWDAKTGQVLLTETVNEFNDQYYNFSYPAYWYKPYENMGIASDNLGMSLQLQGSGPYYSITDNVIGRVTTSDISKYIKLGDELQDVSTGVKYWASSYDDNENRSTVKLISKSGIVIEGLGGKIMKIVRSGNRNLQTATMASVTSMQNPIASGHLNASSFVYLNNESLSEGKAKVINASAVEYSDDWPSQCENGLPNKEGLIKGKGLPVNPYVYNTKGDWRAVRSHAYLTGRNNHETTNRRKAGYFTQFSPFYQLDNAGQWNIVKDDWTSASSVTMYNPYGVELENQDALGRHSSAQYGYEYTLPTAVTSNSEYKEMGFDNFEDYGEYETYPSDKKPHFGFQQALGEGVEVTNEKSHTGQKSIEVGAGKSAVFERRIDDCELFESNPQ